jgi:hypothetical protein
MSDLGPYRTPAPKPDPPKGPSLTLRLLDRARWAKGKLLAADGLDWGVRATVAIAAVVIIGGTVFLVSAFNADEKAWEACEAACEPNLTLHATPHCQCAEPGKDGKVYYVRPKGKEVGE